MRCLAPSTTYCTAIAATKTANTLVNIIDQFEQSIGTSILLICTSASFSFFACAASDAIVVKVYYIPKEIIKMRNIIMTYNRTQG